VWASDLTGRRYRNMAYQIIRNDDLVRYDQTFSMARRYVYLAAKAYDYETGLLRHDGAVGAPGREFLSQIVRARALGRFAADGTPLPGGSIGEPGLADIMARMAANWSVLDGRLNFNNPQVETGTFSLRQELFRIPPGDAFDSSWREILARFKVSDVRDVLEYRTHCLPFTPSSAAEPALVIPFSSTVDFRKNFFGLPLMAGDNAYDSTHFSTKARGVGIWFSNYRNTTLANQPRVYLVPVGEDRMRVPDGVGETIRSWSILDQALPIPFPLSNESWMRPDWNVRTDVLGGEFFARRRLALHAGAITTAVLNERDGHQLAPDWKVRLEYQVAVDHSGWHVAVRRDKGIEQFIRGRELAPGSGTYDGSGVKDIKLFFSTYSYSGIERHADMKTAEQDRKKVNRRDTWRMSLSHLAPLLLCLLCVFGIVTAFASTKRPSVIVYGLIRDSFGIRLPQDSATVGAFLGTNETARTTIRPLLAGANYRFDVNVSDPLTAGLKEIKPGDPVSIRVRVGGVIQPSIGNNTFIAQGDGPGVNINLVLGVDSDGDGLPDDWEWLMIANSGGQVTNLSQVGPGRDLDGDGVPDDQEFWNGTFAFLPDDLLRLANLTQYPQWARELPIPAHRGRQLRDRG
jgi:hypothetical protein